MARAGREEPSGVLFLDKPAGPSSHELVACVRWALGTNRVGHCGTLDPAATGVMVLCVGSATRLADRLSAADKSYTAQIALGSSTTTGDAMGEVLTRESIDERQATRFVEALGSLQGALQLAPPAYSAVHVDGTRAHELARRGEVVELPLREMFVETLTVHGPDASSRVQCTMSVRKGTYVRSLVTRASQLSDVPAHLAVLRRTASGHVQIEDCLGPLLAESWHDDAQGAPRWRIRAPGCEDRASLARYFLAGLRSPEDALGLTSLRVMDASQRHATRRLAMGQRLGLGDPQARWLWEAALERRLPADLNAQMLLDAQIQLDEPALRSQHASRSSAQDQAHALLRQAQERVGVLLCVRDDETSPGPDSGATASSGTEIAPAADQLILVELEQGERGPRLAPRLTCMVPRSRARSQTPAAGAQHEAE